MTIVHVLEPFATGVTTAVISITQQLKELKHVVVHGSRTGAESAEDIKKKFPLGVVFIPWPYAGREISLSRDARALKALVNILRPYKIPVTVIHLHSSKAGVLGRLACRILGISAVIYTPHCASFIRGDIGPAKKKLFRLLERLGGCFGGTVVGCGKSEAELYASMGKKALWVANGIEITVRGTGADRCLVSFAGLADTQKDPALFNRIAAAAKEAPFCWIGDGPLRNELSAPNVTVTGWADKDQVGAYLDRTLVYLSTSAWEGLPFGVLEAMNASCALLLRDVPGNRDLLTPGENGYLFASEEEAVGLLSDMLRDRTKTMAMGARSRAIAEADYTVERMGREYGKIYRAIAEGGQA
jgi:glycosyltransferase involved in cell wall biosynthesis